MRMDAMHTRFSPCEIRVLQMLAGWFVQPVTVYPRRM